MTLTMLPVVAPVELGARHVGTYVVGVLGVGWVRSVPGIVLCRCVACSATMRPVTPWHHLHVGAALFVGVVAHYCRMSIL